MTYISQAGGVFWKKQMRNSGMLHTNFYDGREVKEFIAKIKTMLAL